MKVTEHIERADRPLVSFEIIPPVRGGDLAGLLGVIEELADCRPPFIDITSHAAEVVYDETETGIRRRVKRKRPGSLGVCALVQNKYGIDAVPHVLCRGFTREETEDFLIELRYLGIDNILCVRGDDSGYDKPLRDGRSANRFAVDLVRQVDGMNRGRYLEDELLDAQPSSFCIGVAGYPEKHPESPNAVADVRRTREKIEAGADYVVTQMVFDNTRYFDFVERCRAAGIERPIIPGVKVLTRRRQLRSVPRIFHAEIPPELADEIEAAPAEDIAAIGIEWAVRQTQELIDAGAPAVHFYVMQDPTAVKTVVGRLRR